MRQIENYKILNRKSSVKSFKIKILIEIDLTRKNVV